MSLFRQLMNELQKVDGNVEDLRHALEIRGLKAKHRRGHARLLRGLRLLQFWWTR